MGIEKEEKKYNVKKKKELNKSKPFLHTISILVENLYLAHTKQSRLTWTREICLKRNKNSVVKFRTEIREGIVYVSLFEYLLYFFFNLTDFFLSIPSSASSVYSLH